MKDTDHATDALSMAVSARGNIPEAPTFITGGELHAVIDLETLGIERNSVVLSIGVAIVDVLEPDQDKAIKHKLYMVLGIDEQLAAGRTMSESTLMWWFGGSTDRSPDIEAMHAISRVDVNDKLTVHDALLNLMSLIASAKLTAIWGNSNTFDLEKLYSLDEMDHRAQHENEGGWSPLQNVIKFYREGDIRSVKHAMGKDMNPLNLPERGTSHHALEDAVYEAQMLRSWIAIIRGLHHD